MTQREDGRWVDTIVVNGKRRYFYGKTKAEVKKKMMAFKDNASRGFRFAEAADAWYEEAQNRLAFNTVKSYHAPYLCAKDAFGDRRIGEITPVMVSGELSRYAKLHYTTKTVKNYKLVLNLIFRYAVEKGMAAYNPAADIRSPDGQPNRKRHAPSREDIQRVKDHVSDPFGLFAYMAMYTGLRKGELLALTWNDIDMKNRTISVTKSICHVNNAPTVKLPKTETSVGVVPIVDALMPHLRHKGAGIVFPNKEGEYMTDTQFMLAWAAYKKIAGISASPHQFRHAYATMLFEAGIPPERMQALLRHAQLSTTMDVYKDLRDAELKKIHESVYGVDIG